MCQMESKAALDLLYLWDHYPWGAILADMSHVGAYLVLARHRDDVTTARRGGNLFLSGVICTEQQYKKIEFNV